MTQRPAMSASPSRLESADPVLDALVEEFAQRIQRGEDVSIGDFAERHPGHAERLRRLLPAVRALANFSSPTASSDDLGPAAPQPQELGDFRLVREIGRGGMGIVYEAEQLSLGRRVAVKVLPFAAVLDPRQLQRFKNEARAAATLDHPHIVAVYSVGMERSVHFYAMQFIDGQSLAAVIGELRGERGAPAKPLETTRIGDRQSTSRAGSARERFRQAVRWGIQAARALEHAHQLGIVHRDIKPSNLLVNAEGHLWVADFGLATTSADSDLTMTGDVLGTLRYMSPEQARGEKRILDQRTDIYSLGLTLYEVLALRPAYPETDRRRLLKQILDDEPPPLRRHRPDVPADLETVIRKATAKEPADRYPTAQALADDLERFLAGQPVRARRAGTFERLGKWVRRHRALSALIALALTTALAAPVAFALHAHRLQQANDDLVAKSREADEHAREARRNERQSRQNQYAANTRLAAVYDADGNPAPGELLLQRWVPEDLDAEDFRGFDWGALWNQLIRDSGRWESDRRWAGRLAFGRVPADSGGKARAAHLWWTGPSVFTLGSEGKFDETTLSERRADCEPIWVQSEFGDRLAIGTRDEIEIWDPAARRVVRRIPATAPVQALAMSTSQTRLVWYGGESVHVCRWPEGDELLEARIAVRDPHLLLLPDDESLLICNHHDHPFEIMNLNDGTHHGLADGRVLAEALSPRGDKLVFADYPAIYVVCLPSGRLRRHFPVHEGRIRGLAFRDDSCFAACGDDGMIRWWDVATGRQLGSLHWQTQPIWHIDWQDGGRTLTAYIGPTGTVQQWQLPPETEVRERRRAAGLLAVAPDGRNVAFVNDEDQVLLTDGDFTGSPRGLERNPWSLVDLRISDDGRRLAVSDDRGVGVYTVPAGERLWYRMLRAPRLARFAPEGDKLVVGGGDGQITLLRADDGAVLRRFGEPGPPVRDVLLLPGGEWAAMVAEQGELSKAVKVFRLDGTVATVSRAPGQSTIHSLAPIVGARRFLTFAGGTDVHEYDCEHAPDVDTKPSKVRTDGYRRVDGSQFLNGGSELSSATSVFDVASGTLTWSWNVGAESVAHSQDGRFVFVATGRGELIRWDRRNAVARWLPHCGLRPVYGLAFTGGGSRLLAATSTSVPAFQRENNVRPWLRALKQDVTTYPQAWERTIDSLRAWEISDREEIDPFDSAETRMPHRFVEVAERAGGIVTAGVDGSVWLWKSGSGGRFRIARRMYVSRWAESCCTISELASRLTNSVSVDFVREGEALCGLAVSRDQTRVAAIGHRGSLRVWRLFDGDEVCSATLETASASGIPAWLGWTRDDRHLATSIGGQLRLVDSTSGAVAFTEGAVDGPAVTAGVIAPDGRSLATAHADHAIRIVSLDEKTRAHQVARLVGHVGDILALAISRDGRTLVSGGFDGAIKFWSLETFEETAQISKFRGPVRALRFAPDGRLLAVGGEDEHQHGQVHLLDGSIPHDSGKSRSPSKAHVRD